MGAPPSIYDEEVVEQILDRIMGGESMPAILGVDRPEGWPSFQTWFKWLAKGNVADPEPRFKSLVERYTRACEVRTTAQVEMILHTASKPKISEIRIEREVTGEHGSTTLEIRTIDNTERTKIEIDAMKWTMAKMMPKKYGNHAAISAQSDGDGSIKIIVENAPDAD